LFLQAIEEQARIREKQSEIADRYEGLLKRNHEIVGFQIQQIQAV